jgi:hypothetical protein
MSINVALTDFATDPQLLNLSLSPAQRTVLAAFDGEALSTEEEKIFENCVGRPYTRHRRSNLVAICGARSGKDSRLGVSIGAYQAVVPDHSKYLHRGERAYVLIVCQDQRAGAVTMSYLTEAFKSSPILSSYIKDSRKTELELTNRVVIAAYPSNYRAPRGLTVVCFIGNETSFWRDENSSNPDVEIERAVRRGMAAVPDPRSVLISTPYAKSGLMWDYFRRRHELPDDTLVWVAPTWVMNLAVPQSFLDGERAKDPIAFRREYGAEFAEDISTFLPSEVIDAAVRDYRELPPTDKVQYFGATDASAGGPDAFTAAIAHADGERIVLDWIQGWRRAKPEDTVAEIAKRFKDYRITNVVGDRFSGAWVQDAFHRNQISYEVADKTRSEFYLELAPLLNQGRVDLPNEPTLLKELRGLERRTGTNGRDVVNHMPGQHDDYANSAAIAIVKAQQPRSSLTSDGFFIGRPIHQEFIPHTGGWPKVF